MSVMEPASEYVPRVTKSLIKSPTNFPHFETDPIHFHDSDTSIFMRDGCLLISFNDGKSWETIDVVGNDAYFIEIDPFHKERAFIVSKHEKFYVTEDRGRNWKELPIPKVPSEFVGSCSIETHPIDKKLLFFIFQDYPVKYFYFSDIYASNDGGLSFRYLSPPVNYQETSSLCSMLGWHFAVSSLESTIENTGIYFIHEATYDDATTAEVFPKKTFMINLKSGERKAFKRVYTFFFYAADFSKTTSAFDESAGSSTDDTCIFPSNTVVLASEEDAGEKIKDLWVSKGDQPFEPVSLPSEVVSLRDARFFSGDKKRLILLTVGVNECDKDDTRLLVLDISNLDLTWDSKSYYDDVSKSLKELGDPGTTQRKIVTEYPSKADCCCETDFDFNDADCLMFIINRFLHVSFDAGESWQIIDGVGNDASSVKVDPFHKGRAFVASNGGKLFVTEDRGSNWRELHVPKAMHEHIKLDLQELQTHPIDRKLLLFPDRRVIWTSNDGGQSFSCISPPVNFPVVPADAEVLDCTLDGCHFAASSEESTLGNNGFFYIYSLNLDFSGSEDDKDVYIRTLFYTPDFGKTTKIFDEWKGSSVNRIFIFPSSVFVLTAEGEFDEENKKLWISKGEGFEPLPLPDKVLFLQDVKSLSRDGYERLLVTVMVNDNKHDCLLILDPSNLNFSFRGPILPWFYEERDFEDFQYRGQLDNSSGKYSHLIEYDTNDLEPCSFREAHDTCECCTPHLFQNEPTAGIMMKRGTVGKNKNIMTFTSHNGGISWDVALEFPVYEAFLDFGNIIVAMRWPSENSETQGEFCYSYSGFYFSLDQGRSWNEYRFDRPIESELFSIYGFGLKALIEIKSEREKSALPEFVFYSIDFSNIFGADSCTEEDLKRWYLCGKPIDDMIHRFDRRKPDAKCLVRKNFEKLGLREEECDT